MSKLWHILSFLILHYSVHVFAMEDYFKIISKEEENLSESDSIVIFAKTTNTIRICVNRLGKEGNYNYTGYIYDFGDQEYLVKPKSTSSMEALWKALSAEYDLQQERASNTKTEIML